MSHCCVKVYIFIQGAKKKEVNYGNWMEMGCDNIQYTTNKSGKVTMTLQEVFGGPEPHFNHDTFSGCSF